YTRSKRDWSSDVCSSDLSLAIIPGAGGTQRLTRLIGIGQAKRLIYTGSPVTAKEALSLGLIEEITTSSAKEAALLMAKKIAKNEIGRASCRERGEKKRRR